VMTNGMQRNDSGFGHQPAFEEKHWPLGGVPPVDEQCGGKK
jgi:hypothetical protein